jgi:hypothetical protein
LDDSLGDVVRLQESFGLIGLTLKFVDKGLHGCGSSSGKDTEDADTVTVEFGAQTVGDGSQSAFRSSIGPDLGSRRRQCRARIHKDDLPAARDEQRQQVLRQQVRRAQVNLVKAVQFSHRQGGLSKSWLDSPV